MASREVKISQSLGEGFTARSITTYYVENLSEDAKLHGLHKPYESDWAANRIRLKIKEQEKDEQDILLQKLEYC